MVARMLTIQQVRQFRPTQPSLLRQRFLSYVSLLQLGFQYYPMLTQFTMSAKLTISIMTSVLALTIRHPTSSPSLEACGVAHRGPKRDNKYILVHLPPHTHKDRAAAEKPKKVPNLANRIGCKQLLLQGVGNVETGEGGVPD